MSKTPPDNCETRQKVECEQCQFYYGKYKINCGVHPFGKTAEHCNDWQPKTLNKIQETREIRSSTVLLLLILAIAIWLASKLFDAAPPHIAYCIKTLERAADAETIGVAKEALKDGSLCVEYNYPQDSSEYRDIQSNLKYLSTQPDNVTTPQFIKDSLTKTKNIFTKDFLGESPLFYNFVFVVGGFALLMFVFLQDFLGTDVED